MTAFITLAALASVALMGLTGMRLYRIFARVATARGASRRDQPALRWKGMLSDIFLHRRLRRFTFSGVLHGLIFFGFLILMTAAAQAFLAAVLPAARPLTEALVHGPVGVVQELAGLSVLAGLGLAMWHRYVRKPARFKGSNARDAALIYVFVFAIVATMFLEFAASRQVSGGGHWAFHPLSAALAQLIPEASAESTLTVARWLHVIAILAFLAYVPGSKHRHFILAAPNIYFRSLKPKGYLPEPHEHIQKAEEDLPLDLSWKDQLDVLSCTECGRCQSVCPAASSGAPLSPKLVITTLRDQSQDGGPLRFEMGISKEALWSCTSCRACMEECPLHIEHVPKIVDLRRMLVEEGEVEPGLQNAFTQLQKTGNSFGKPAKARARWTKEVSQPIPDARKQEVEWLWFVGDVASFDPRAQETTRRLAEILQKAGVDFGILYEGERNSGNDVRRAGEEGAFRELAAFNMASLEQAQFRKIFTTDPHSLNALRNEYAELGGHYEVYHHSALLLELLESGRLTTTEVDEGMLVTYHDPCYLGRYNDEFDAPRALIAASGFNLVEMPRNRDKSFCCGAGGGRFWMDDSVFEERPSESRIKEAMAVAPIRRFIVSCPKDKVMYTAAVGNLGKSDDIQVVDIVDLVWEKYIAV